MIFGSILFKKYIDRNEMPGSMKKTYFSAVRDLARCSPSSQKQFAIYNNEQVSSVL